MISQLLGISRNTFVECLRQPVFLILVLVSAFLQYINTATTGFAMGYTTSAEVHGDDKLLFDVGLATVFGIGMLLAAFQATAVISREIESKTVLTVVSKPVQRTTLIIGKFIGVSGAIAMATVMMLIFLLMAVRHSVMSTASDSVDMPVVVFGLSAIFGSVLLAGWCNFFYGWSFSQVSITAMFPSLIAAFLGTLMVSPEWQFQAIGTDFKPQVTTACGALALSIMVMTSVATAASARFGQVMTIVACVGVFLLGLLSNHLIGRHIHQNTPASAIVEIEFGRVSDEDFQEPGATAKLILEGPPKVPMSRGDAVYYGPDPSGVAMAVGSFDAPDPELDFDSDRQIYAANQPPAVIADVLDGPEMEIKIIGGGALDRERPPEAGDFIFTEPTGFNPLAWAVAAVVPNMQAFWLLDAVTQNRPVPSSHLLMLLVYASSQIAAFLGLAVILFERRDVG